MIYYSSSKKSICKLVQELMVQINMHSCHISLSQNLNKKNIAIIPIYGEEELNEEWMIFFQKISNNSENIGKQLVIYFYGVYDCEASKDLTIVKQIKFLCEFISLRLHFYPIKLINTDISISNILYFYNHIEPFIEHKNEFDRLMNNIIFYAKDFPIADNKKEIDFTSKRDEYSNILNSLPDKYTLNNILNYCDRSILILNRIHNPKLFNNMTDISNNQINTLHLKSNKIKETPIFAKLDNLITLNLTANYLTSFCTDKIPNSLRNLILAKNLLTKIELIKSDNLLRLSLFNNSIKNFQSIVNLTNLLYLNIGLNKLIKIPSEIFECKNLKHLNICLNDIDLLPFEILQLEKLEILDITGCEKLKNNSIISKLKERGVRIIF